MTDPKSILQRLQTSLNILQEREAKYGLDAPVALIHEIEDHQTAITLTEDLVNGHLSETDWREQLRPLLVEIKERGATGEISDLNIGGVSFGDITIGGDVIGGDNVQQTAGDYSAQASHGGAATVNAPTYNQQGQYNAARDIHIHHPPATTISPAQRTGYAVGGLLLGLVANIAINLLSAAIQQRYFGDQFSDQSIWVLAAFALFGSLLGLWLSGPVPVPAAAAPAQTQPSSHSASDWVSITRLRALLSYTKLRGHGIHLSDILLIASKLDIDTGSNDDPSHH
ncbi:MAG TPA: hypothetical protein VGD99_02125 [Anaerolineae bacterium]